MNRIVTWLRWSVPAPKAAYARGTESASCCSRHGYSGAYLASTSKVDCDVVVSAMRLFSLTFRKLPRSTDTLVTEEYSWESCCCLSTSVLLVVVRSDSALRKSGAAWL